MAEPLTWQVVEALERRLSAIRIAAGWHTDIGDTVLLDDSLVDEDAAPCVRVQMTDTAPSANSTARILAYTASLTVVAYLVADGSRAAMREAHRVRADLLRALADTSRDMPKTDIGGTVSIVVERAQILTRPDGLSINAVQIDLTAGLSERTPKE